MDFPRTSRLISNESLSPQRAAAAAVFSICAIWLLWFAFSRLPLYLVSDQAKIESSDPVHLLRAEISGRVVKNILALGREVRQGEVLLQLDSRDKELSLLGLQSELEGQRGIERATAEEIENLESALEEGKAADEIAQRTAAAQVEQSRIDAQLAKETLDKNYALYKKGVVADLRLKELSADHKKKESLRQAAEFEAEKLGIQARARQKAEAAEISDLKRQQSETAGRVKSLEAEIARTRHEIDKHAILAPSAGRLAKVETLPVGSLVAGGQTVASLLPEGDLQVVAAFDSPTAAGRLRPGQPARLSLRGFPWTEYGYVRAEVARVAAEESEDRSLRVEMRIDRASSSKLIQLQHGLAGSVEVEIERVSPFKLLLRSAGSLLSQRDGP